MSIRTGADSWEDWWSSQSSHPAVAVRLNQRSQLIPFPRMQQPSNCESIWMPSDKRRNQVQVLLHTLHLNIFFWNELITSSAQCIAAWAQVFIFTPALWLQTKQWRPARGAGYFESACASSQVHGCTDGHPELPSMSSLSWQFFNRRNNQPEAIWFCLHILQNIRKKDTILRRYFSVLTFDLNGHFTPVQQLLSF